MQFNQPSASSRVLNRVDSADPTSILGTLRANGIVYLINPAGLYFGKTSFIDVGGLFAAAGTISNQDFLANVNRFSGLNGAVNNAGSIESGAMVNLIGRTVANQGHIVSRNGPVALLAGNGWLCRSSARSCGSSSAASLRAARIAAPLFADHSAM